MKRKMSKKALVSAAIAAGFLGWVTYGATGCELIAAVDRTKIGNNAGGSAGSTSDGGGGSGATGGADGGGGVGGMECMDSDCPGNATQCRMPACLPNGDCGFENTAAGTACTDGVDDAHVCDGAGDCVECVDNADCDFDVNATICLMNECVNAACANGALDDNETDVDCGGACPGCAETLDCNVADDCLSGVCDTAGGGGGGAGGGPAGTCVPCTANGDCASDQWCDSTAITTVAADGRCADDKMGGNAEDCTTGMYTGDAQCAGNANCVDGYCCDTPCSATCAYCANAGSLGTCDFAPAADPRDDCALVACNTGNCTGTSNACDPQPNTFECDADGGECDVADNCDGTSLTCTDTFEPASTPCGPGVAQPTCNPDHCAGAAVSEACIDEPALTGNESCAENPGVGGGQCAAGICEDIPAGGTGGTGGTGGAPGGGGAGGN